MHTKRYLAVGLLAIMVGVVLIMIAFARPEDAQSRLSQSRTTGIKKQGALGFPAITPHINLTSLYGTMPTFTVEDVKLFVTQHGSPAGPLMKGGHLTFIKILFVTSKEASVLMQGESTGLSDNAPVCYILIHGLFAVTNMHLNPSMRMPKAATETELVFDGRTGNFLVWGIPGPAFIWS